MSYSLSVYQRKVIYFEYTKAGFFATGSWESHDPNVKTDMTETQIDCFKEMKTCVMATADNLMGRPHVFTSYLNVIKWDDDGLIAIDSSAICMNLTMQVSVADKHITLIHTLKRQRRRHLQRLPARVAQSALWRLRGQHDRE